jgi:3,4-dihydroxy-2-butanone 4-phosphate synthase
MSSGTTAVDEVPHGPRDRPSAAVHRALEALRAGAPVVVGAAPWAFLVLDGRSARATGTAALIRHGSGLLHVAVKAERMAALGIPPMPVDSGSRCARVHVAVDAAAGITTGISAADRAETVRRLSDSTSGPRDFIRPGHVLPVVAEVRPSSAPADVALVLSALAGATPPVAAYCALVSAFYRYRR